MTAAPRGDARLAGEARAVVGSTARRRPTKGVLRRHLVVAAAWLLVVLAGAGEARAAWKQLDSAHFVVIGDGRDGEIREAARRFEAFRAAIEQLLVGARQSPARLVIIVCGSKGSFDALRPVYEGRPLREIGGYFQPGSETSYIVLGPSGTSDETLRVVLHEYAHALTAGGAETPPAWLNEGLAEYFSTFSLRAGLRVGEIGGPIRHHLDTLRDRFIPLSELLTVDYASPFYNEDARRSIFYAESWALVHYLLLERRVGVGALTDYSTRVARGEPPHTAFAALFGAAVDDIEREVQAYVRRPALGGHTVAFGAPVHVEASRQLRPLPEAAVDATLADLFLLQRRDDEALARGARALAAVPDLPDAHTVLGVAEWRRGRMPAALDHLRSAARGAPDGFSPHLQLGRALLQDAQRAARTDPRITEACRALARATEIRPSSDQAWAWLARCHLRSGADHDGALEAATKAVAAAPDDAEHYVVLAQARLAHHSLADARAALDVARHRGSSETRARAQQVMSVLTAIEDEARARLAFIERTDDTELLTAVSASLRRSEAPPPAESPAAASVASPQNTAASYPLPEAPGLAGELRVRGSDEHRDRGYLRQIECRASQVVIHVQLHEGVRRVGASRLENVVVFSYRDDVKGDITCGTTEAGKTVLVTWTTPPQGENGAVTEGRVVAIEFVPPGFIPR